MIGIIDVGGGMKGIYSSGLYDYLMDKGIYFDYNLGVSSGTANLITYIARQRGRTYRFYHDYSFHRKYFSVTNLITNRGSLLGLDYIYSEICNSDGIDPLDYEAIEKADCIYKAAATVAKTGKVHYFDKSDFKKDDYAKRSTPSRSLLMRLALSYDTYCEEHGIYSLHTGHRQYW